VVCFAGPRWGVEETTQKGATEDVVFALDVSKSMLVADMSPTRLARAKAAIAGFVRRKGTGNVGLIAFALMSINGAAREDPEATHEAGIGRALHEQQLKCLGPSTQQNHRGCLARKRRFARFIQFLSRCWLIELHAAQLNGRARRRPAALPFYL
jgi:hypothetical protein